ncbi:hypothetical protein GCM10010520_13930 [Rhizobium viscosum]|uniref:ABC-type branched-subunit amino acid transport system ATPase component n=1 Tax=Rhizobium viscosum TaxID=1673 RepID=A0ABR9IXW2_RHIVS|nr:ATP-binding cassette domain-containing protein [Rhizobium viscosum]MBE1508063.1 ABC-type branched-subunit amino acid transport system ATPase component [Rhizobium viscosum]
MSESSEVSVENLVVERGGKRVIHDISFSVAAGKVTTLLGANGAGKSSTVMAMAGVLPRGGAVRLGDIALEGFAPDRIRHAGLALVPEGHRVLGQLLPDSRRPRYGRAGSELMRARMLPLNHRN